MEMKNNSVKRLAENPHYSMSDEELDALASILAEEAEEAKKQEEMRPAVKLNKNKVKKSTVSLNKTPVIQEVDEDGHTR